MLPRTILLLVFMSATGPAFAVDQPGVVLPQPIVLRLRGHFADDRRAAQEAAPDAVLVRVDGVERWLAVERARTVADHALDGRDVLAALAPIQPNLIAVGPDDLRRRLREMPAGTALEIEGVVSRGSRTFLLRSVEVGAAAK